MKTWFITGTSSGFGRALAEALIAKGERVIATARKIESLAGLVATELGRIPQAGDTVEVADWHLDVVDASGRRAARVLLHAPLVKEDEEGGEAK
jgi:NAD(P)-dependent dehydrogenase (short-subunit alcohol dehydrogenase family)